MELNNPQSKENEREYLRQTILEMREMGCNKVADMLCDELAELDK